MMSLKEYLNENQIALSIKQPWAWLIVQGHKDIENRNWNTKYRGLFYVHSGKSFDNVGYEYVKNNFKNIILPDKEDFLYGGIIGKCELVDVVTSSNSPWFDGKYGFILKNAKPIKYIQYPGKLKFFNINIEEK